MKNTYVEYTDPEIINKIKSDQDSDAVKALADRHSGLIFGIAGKYGINQTSGTPYHDLDDQKLSIVWDAAQTYDPSKNTQFDTWLGNNVRYYCLKKITKAVRNNEVSIEENPIDNIPISYDDNSVGENTDYILDIAAQMKDSRVINIMKDRYCSGGRKVMNYADLGKKYNLSPQGVKNIHDSFIGLVKKKMNSENLVDRV